MSTQARAINDISSDEINSYSLAHFIVADALALCREKLLAQEINAADPASRGLILARRDRTSKPTWHWFML